MNFSCIVNVSKDRLTPFAWSTEHPVEDNAVQNGYGCAAAALMILLLGTPWNTFVVLTIIWKKLYKTPSVIPMLNLAISNLMVCLLILPFIIISGFSTEFLFGSSDYVRCKVCALGAANVTLPLVSLYTLALLSVGRLLYLKVPLHYNSIVTPCRVVAIIIGIWIFCIVIALPPFFGFGSIKFAYVVATCVPLVVGESHILPNLDYCLTMIPITLTPLAILTVMYIWIVCIARKFILKNPERFAMLHDHSCSNESVPLKQCSILEERERLTSVTHRKQQFRMVQVLGAIVLANIITWIPMMILGIAGAITGPNLIPTELYSTAYTCYISEVMIHPLLQAILIYEIKETMVGIWSSFRKRICGCYKYSNMVKSEEINLTRKSKNKQ